MCGAGRGPWHCHSAAGFPCHISSLSSAFLHPTGMLTTPVMALLKLAEAWMHCTYMNALNNKMLWWSPRKNLPNPFHDSSKQVFQKWTCAEVACSANEHWTSKSPTQSIIPSSERNMQPVSLQMAKLCKKNPRPPLTAQTSFSLSLPVNPAPAHQSGRWIWAYTPSIHASGP